MLNAVGYVIKQTDGRYRGIFYFVSIKAVIDILPNMRKTYDSQPDFHSVTEADAIGAGWTTKGETSNEEYVSLSNVSPVSEPEKLYGNFGMTADSDDRDFYAVIWNPAD